MISLSSRPMTNLAPGVYWTSRRGAVKDRHGWRIVRFLWDAVRCAGKGIAQCVEPKLGSTFRIDDLTGIHKNQTTENEV